MGSGNTRLTTNEESSSRNIGVVVLGDCGGALLEVFISFNGAEMVVVLVAVLVAPFPLAPVSVPSTAAFASFDDGVLPSVVAAVLPSAGPILLF